MINLVSSVQQDWDYAASPFYLELYGESAPQLDTAFAEVIPAGTATDKDVPPSVTNSAPVYQYWWTIGVHRSGSVEKRVWRDRIDVQEATPDDGAMRNLEFADPAAHVRLYFPTTVNWRVKEIIASVKYLTPIRNQHQLWQDVSDNIAKLLPLLSGAGSLANLAPGGGAVSTVLSAVAKLQVASVPQTSVNWSVEKTVHLDAKLRQPWQGVSGRCPRIRSTYSAGA